MKISITILIFFSSLNFCAQTNQTKNEEAKEKYDKVLEDLVKKGETNEKIISYFLQELKSHPNNEFILRNLGYISIEANQLEEGEKYYLEAIKINPECARCYMNLARVYAAKKDIKKTFELLDKSIKTDPKEDLAYFYRAQSKENTGDKFGALFDYNKAIELNPQNASYYAKRGEFNYNKNYLSLALTDMNKSIEIDSSNYYSYYIRANVYARMQQFKEALSDINAAIKLDSNKQEVYTTRGGIYSTYNEHEKAISDFTKAITLDPKIYMPYGYRAFDKYALENLDGSCSDVFICYELLKKNDPSNDMIKILETSIVDYCDSTKASYYYQRGIAYYNLNEYEKAVDIYSKGLKKFPNNPLTLQFRGNAYLELNDYQNAIADYQDALMNKEEILKTVKLNQRFTNASADSINQYIKGFTSFNYLSVAKAKFLLGKYDEALVEINKGIEIAEIDKEGFYNLRGFIFIAQGKYQDAINDYDKCLHINPSFTDAYVNRAVSKYSMANQTKTTTYSIGAGISYTAYNPHWTFPLKTKAKKTDLSIISALDDCNKAIEIEPMYSFAYYVRGQIKKTLGINDYCYDLLKAKNLGYPIDNELINDCK